MSASTDMLTMHRLADVHAVGNHPPQHVRAQMAAVALPDTRLRELPAELHPPAAIGATLEHVPHPLGLELVDGEALVLSRR